jgi:virginiamycin B lyase
MDRNSCARRSIYCKSLVLVLLLTFIGLLGGCGTSTTTNPSPTPGPTLTVTRELKGTISEFPLPNPDFRPGDITGGPDGNLWFTTLGTTPQTGKIGRITPAGVVSEFSLPFNSFSNSITAGPDGNIWFKVPDKIGRITPAGKISEFPLSSSSLVDIGHWPDTLYGSTLWGDITAGPDGALWFTEPGTAVQNGKIGRITPTGTINEFPLPASQTHPLGITKGPDGNLWFIGYSGNNVPRGIIWRITPTGTISEFPLPSGFFLSTSRRDQMATSGLPKLISMG